MRTVASEARRKAPHKARLLGRPVGLLLLPVILPDRELCEAAGLLRVRNGSLWEEQADLQTCAVDGGSGESQ